MLEGADLIPSVITGVSVAVPTVVAIKVDVKWVKREIERLDSAVIRAHERIDALERGRQL